MYVCVCVCVYIYIYIYICCVVILHDKHKNQESDVITVTRGNTQELAHLKHTGMQQYRDEQQ
jgi:hypothetical protein